MFFKKLKKVASDNFERLEVASNLKIDTALSNLILDIVSDVKK